MAKVKKEKGEKCDMTFKSKCGHGCSGCGYFLGFIGAVIYYISIASGFWMGVLGVLKALIWPLFLVLEVLKFVAA